MVEHLPHSSKESRLPGVVLADDYANPWTEVYAGFAETAVVVEGDAGDIHGRATNNM
jgi:hypothetical protein